MAIIIIATLYYNFVFKNLERVIKSQDEHKFVSHMQMKAMCLDNALSKYILGTKSISSRTAIRQNIIEFKHGAISINELKKYTNPKYIEGINALEDVIMAKRYVNSQIVAQVGECKIADAEVLLKDSTQKQIKIGFLLKNSMSLVYVVSPIVYNSNILGHDIICYDNKSIALKIADPNIEIGLLYNLQDISTTTSNGGVTYSSDKATCFIKSEQTDAYFQFTIPQDILLKDLNIFYKNQLPVIMLILICIIFIAYTIHRRAMLILVKESEKRLQSIFENPGGVMLLINPDTQYIEDGNQAASSFYGYSLEQLKTMKVTELSYLLTEEETAVEINAVRNGEMEYFKFKHQLSNGEVKDVEVYPSLIDFGNEIKILLVMHEITERKKTEEKINQLNSTLSNTIEELNTTNENGEVRVYGKKEQDTVQIKISDNGLGMDEQTMESLFKIGETKSQKGTNNEQGTGFGLLLIKEFVDIHRGIISVKSEIGKGSTFTITSYPQTT